MHVGGTFDREHSRRRERATVEDRRVVREASVAFGGRGVGDVPAAVAVDGHDAGGIAACG